MIALNLSGKTPAIMNGSPLEAATNDVRVRLQAPCQNAKVTTTRRGSRSAAASAAEKVRLHGRDAEDFEEVRGHIENADRCHAIAGAQIWWMTS